MNSNIYWIYSNFHDENTKRLFEIIPDHLKDHLYNLVLLADEGLKDIYELSSESEMEDEPDEPFIMDYQN